MSYIYIYFLNRFYFIEMNKKLILITSLLFMLLAACIFALNYVYSDCIKVSVLRVPINIVKKWFFNK